MGLQLQLHGHTQSRLLVLIRALWVTTEREGALFGREQADRYLNVYPYSSQRYLMKILNRLRILMYRKEAQVPLLNRMEKLFFIKLIIYICFNVKINSRVLIT